MKFLKKATLSLLAVCVIVLCTVLCAANVSAAEVTASGTLTYDEVNLVDYAELIKGPMPLATGSLKDAFDGNPATIANFGVEGGEEYWLGIKLPEPTVLTYFSCHPDYRDDGTLRTWAHVGTILEGSNDGENWEFILMLADDYFEYEEYCRDMEDGINNWFDEYAWDLDNNDYVDDDPTDPVAYTYYRIWNTSWGLALYGDIQLYGYFADGDYEPNLPETAAPETEAPETAAPETEAPETAAPETEAPETAVPETEAPETAAPETEAPETAAPETAAPETAAPETAAPETEAPETEAPETAAPGLPPAECDITVSFSDVTAHPGDVIDIEISIESNAVWNSLALSKLTYDPSVLTFIGFVNYDSTILQKHLFGADAAIDEQLNTIVIGLMEPQMLSGKLCDLRFEVNEDADVGDYSVYMENLIVKADSTPINSKIKAATVSITPPLLGDINIDGTVDIQDAILLFRYSMLPTLYPIEYKGSVDFNKDECIDVYDCNLLFCHSMMPDLYPIG